MSKADALLNSLAEPVTYNSSSEPHIVIGEDRFITVPDSLKRIAVQYDHDIETVTFDCPRYWDDNDMSKMQIYINYMLPNNRVGQYLAKNVVVSGDNMSFDWTISNNVTQFKGNIAFLVCINKTDDNGNEERHWNSELNRDLYISEGLEFNRNTIISSYPDIITQLLTRMDEVEDIATPEAMQAYVNAWFAKNGDDLMSDINTAAADAVEEIERKRAEVLESIPEDYATTARWADEGAHKKANAILMEDAGEVIAVNDSADAYLLNLKLYGKTEQYTTTGKQLFDAFTNEIFNTKAVYTVDGDTITYDSSEVYMVLRMRVPRENLIAGKTYVMECDSISKGLTCQLLGNNVEAGQSLIDARLMNGNTRVEFTIPSTVDMSLFDTFNEGTAYLAMSLFVSETSYVQVVQTIKGLRLYAADNPMTEWEAYSGGVASPSPQYPMALRSIENPITHIHGSNIFPIQEADAVGLTGIPQPDGSVHYTGTATENAWHAFQQCPIYRTGTYSLTVETKNKTTKGSLIQVFEPGNMVGRTWANTLDEFTCTFDARAGGFVRVCIGVNKGDVVDLNIKIGLAPGNAAVDWLPHVPDQTIAAQHTLNGIPVTSGGNYIDSNGQRWICDEIDFDRGVLIQRCFSEILPFAFQEGLNRYSATLTHTADSSCAVDQGIPVYSSKLKFHPAAGSGTPMTNGIRVAATSPKYAIACYNGDVIESVDITYPLANPIETPLTAEEIANFKMVCSNYHNTTVMNDAGAYMKLDYVADTKMFFENHSIATDEQVENAVDNWFAKQDGSAFPAYTESDYGKVLSCTAAGLVWIEAGASLPDGEEMTF